jgi:hypothetical protein
MRMFGGFSVGNLNQQQYAPPRAEQNRRQQAETNTSNTSASKFKPNDEDYVDWEEVK